MKTKISEMTQEEILVLEPKDIEYLIQYAMAEEGVKFLPEPKAPESFVPEYDAEVYEVQGMYFSEFDIAEIVRCCLSDHAEYMRRLDYNWSQSSKYKYVREDGDFYFSVQKVRVFTPTKYQRLAAEMTKLERAKTEYEALKKEYESEEKKKRAIKEEIYSVVEEAHARRYRFERHCAEYQRYVELAKGDSTIAKVFFEKAYSLGNEELAEVYAKVTPCQP